MSMYRGWPPHGSTCLKCAYLRVFGLLALRAVVRTDQQCRRVVCITRSHGFSPLLTQEGGLGLLLDGSGDGRNSTWNCMGKEAVGEHRRRALDVTVEGCNEKGGTSHGSHAPRLPLEARDTAPPLLSCWKRTVSRQPLSAGQAKSSNALAPQQQQHARTSSFPASFASLVASSASLGSVRGVVAAGSSMRRRLC